MLKTLPVGEMTTRIIQDEAGWDAIQNDWNTLYVLSPMASTPLDFSCLQGWWQTYNDPGNFES
jgi:hypothetical protein